MSIRLLTYQQSVFWALSQWQTFLRVFTYKMAAKINWHRYGTKLHHCHPMYRGSVNWATCSLASSCLRRQAAIILYWWKTGKTAAGYGRESLHEMWSAVYSASLVVGSRSSNKWQFDNGLHHSINTKSYLATLIGTIGMLLWWTEMPEIVSWPTNFCTQRRGYYPSNTDIIKWVLYTGHSAYIDVDWSGRI